MTPELPDLTEIFKNPSSDQKSVMSLVDTMISQGADRSAIERSIISDKLDEGLIYYCLSYLVFRFRQIVNTPRFLHRMMLTSSVALSIKRFRPISKFHCVVLCLQLAGKAMWAKRRSRA